MLRSIDGERDSGNFDGRRNWWIKPDIKLNEALRQLFAVLVNSLLSRISAPDDFTAIILEIASAILPLIVLLAAASFSFSFIIGREPK